MNVWTCKLIFHTDTLQQKIEITDLKPFLTGENTSWLKLLHSTVYRVEKVQNIFFYRFYVKWMTSRILLLWRPFLHSCILIAEAEWAELWKHSPFQHLNHKNNTVQTVKLISQSKWHIETLFLWKCLHSFKGVIWCDFKFSFLFGVLLSWLCIDKIPEVAKTKVSKPKRYSFSKLRLCHAPLKRFFQTRPHMSTSRCGNICIMQPKCSCKARRISFHSSSTETSHLQVWSISNSIFASLHVVVSLGLL